MPTNCPAFAYCPPSNGSVSSCIQNCNCVYCGAPSQIDACTQLCQKNNGATSVGVNTQAVNDTIGSIQNALLGHVLNWLPGVLERIGLFLFALILVIVGFLILK